MFHIFLSIQFPLHCEGKTESCLMHKHIYFKFNSKHRNLRVNLWRQANIKTQFQFAFCSSFRSTFPFIISQCGNIHLREVSHQAPTFEQRTVNREHRLRSNSNRKCVYSFLSSRLPSARTAFNLHCI